jgi:hypothetical protein
MDTLEVFMVLSLVTDNPKLVTLAILIGDAQHLGKMRQHVFSKQFNRLHDALVRKSGPV